jgi:FkbM family methyltransferase
MAEHNQAFSSFTARAGELPLHFASDFLGSKISHGFVAGLSQSSSEVSCDTESLPPFDEEYFEWIDLLSAVLEAEGCFTMIELGAGFGRWVVRGGLAARQRNLPCKLVAVEAEPTVYGWTRQHFATNGLPPEDHMLLHGAVTETPGRSAFYIGGPRGGEWDRNPNAWYGQRLTKDYDLAGESTADGGYCGFPVMRHASGWRSISVPGASLSSILLKLDLVDLIDMDIEGEELPTVRVNIKRLNRQVKRLHIGTHSTEIEAGLRDLLRAHGWKCEADYPLSSTATTLYGDISFENGAQSWINPRVLNAPTGLSARLQRRPLFDKLLSR